MFPFLSRKKSFSSGRKNIRKKKKKSEGRDMVPILEEPMEEQKQKRTINI